MRPETKEGLAQMVRAACPSVVRAAAAPRVKRPVAQWAREVRKMRGGPLAGNNTIPFSTEFVPHTVAQMEACDDPRVNLIVIWGPIRDAKTTAALCAIGRTVTDDPGGIFSVWPTKEDADKFSEDDLETMIELSLSAYFVAKKSRDSGRTKAFKKFRGGSIRIPSAGAITAFRGSTVKVLHLPEADALEPESIYKAFGRTTGISDAIKIMESTGTLASEVGEDGKTIWRSVIAEHYDQSDQQKWFVECAECHELSVIYYPQIRADSGDMRDAKWHCPRCDHGHDEVQWFRAAQGGAWYPTAGLSADDLLDIRANHHKARAKRPEYRGFWRNGFNSLLPTEKGFASKLHQFLAEGEAAKTNPDKLKTWTNEIAAELWSSAAQAEELQWKPVFERREDYGLTVPAGGLFLTAFADIQKNRIEVGWRAYGRREESWGMDYVVLDGYTGHPEVWSALRKELARKFDHQLGAKIGLGMAFVDGGAYAEHVYRFFQRLSRDPEPGVNGHCCASKGIGAHPHLIVSRGPLTTVAKTLKGRHIGTWQAKDAIFERLKMEFTPGDDREGVMHYNMRFPESYFIGLAKERPTRVSDKGQEFNKWRDEVSGNEPLDIEVGCYAAFLLNPKTDHTFEQLEADIKERAELIRSGNSRAPRPAEHRNSSVVIAGWR